MSTQPVDHQNVFEKLGDALHITHKPTAEETPVSSAATATATTKHNGFVTVMEQIGKDFLKGLTIVEAYLPTAAALVGAIFPQSAVTSTVVGKITSVVGLIQTAVTTVEQKMAAAGAVSGTGPQKLADVLQIVTPVATQLLEQAGLPTDQTYITALVNAVVAILNVQVVGIAPAPAAPAQGVQVTNETPVQAGVPVS